MRILFSITYLSPATIAIFQSPALPAACVASTAWTMGRKWNARSESHQTHADQQCFSCEASSDHYYPQSFQGEGLKKLAERAPAYSTDGSCGPQHGNTICDPKSTAYTVSDTRQASQRHANIQLGRMLLCKMISIASVDKSRVNMSQSYGWCGNTAAHCGTGCVSGCTTTDPPTTNPTAPRPDGRCGKDFGGATCDAKGAYGGCCSEYGYCGKSTDQ